jgi:hypothetical protein
VARLVLPAPGAPARSSSTTRFTPSDARWKAQLAPTTPAPTTIASAEVMP